MNLQRSDDELRFEAQQIEDARLDAAEAPANPLAAALGLVGTVVIIALIFLLWSIIEILIRMVCYAVDGAKVLVDMVHSVRWLGEAGLEPYAEALIALVGATICLFAYRFLTRVRSVIAAFARRRRS